jgi:hypothetical protein
VGGDIDIGVRLGEAGQGLRDLQLVLLHGARRCSLLVRSRRTAAGPHECTTPTPEPRMEARAKARSSAASDAALPSTPTATRPLNVGPVAACLCLPDHGHRARCAGRDADADRAEEEARQGSAATRAHHEEVRPAERVEQYLVGGTERQVLLHLDAGLDGLHPGQRPVEVAAPDHPHLLAELGHPDTQGVPGVRGRDGVHDQQRTVLGGRVVGGPVEGQLAVRR